MCSTQKQKFKLTTNAENVLHIYVVRYSLIIMSRRLTGKWYLKKKLFGFVVMVETIQTTTCEFDFSTSPEFTRWEKAKESDFVELGINCA
jgi:hypothetical protein